MRTARSRTSGENFTDFFMALSSQELEPPPNPGRFRTAISARNGTSIPPETWSLQGYGTSSRWHWRRGHSLISLARFINPRRYHLFGIAPCKNHDFACRYLTRPMGSSFRALYPIDVPLG